MTSQNLVKQIDLPPKGHYVVAVSGGVDSIVLLHLLAHTDCYRLRVAHFDHGWREDSDRDRRFVQQMARIYGLPFHSQRAEDLKLSEEAGRQSRYAFLHKLASDYGASGIITAHHLDDRQETSLFNILRGSGWVGAAPMVNNEGKVLRPLLKVRKTDLYSYARHHGLPWREDASNNDISFDRNFLRHEVLPQARLQNADFDQQYHDSMARLDQLNQRLSAELDRIIKPAYVPDPPRFEFDRQVLVNLSLVSLKQVLATAVRRLQPSVQLSAVLLNQLALFTKKAHVASAKSLPAKLKLSIGYDKVTIASDERAAPVTSATELPPQTSVLFGSIWISYGEVSEPMVVVEPQPLRIRTVQAGDRIAPVGMVGRKKLQDLFVDAKVPRGDRLSYPVVVALNDEIVWVPGLAFNRHFLPAANAPVYGLSYTK
ncbi:MAG TPA: tRNA lysidine(34) synthetase TilS [Candidatus Saccharimonadia bacterium]|nr:tRNA lysidine(34) synthetase TilS [Candidatus Saccharimonadia bacterium]